MYNDDERRSEIDNDDDDESPPPPPTSAFDNMFLDDERTVREWLDANLLRDEDEESLWIGKHFLACDDHDVTFLVEEAGGNDRFFLSILHHGDIIDPFFFTHIGDMLRFLDTTDWSRVIESLEQDEVRDWVYANFYEEEDYDEEGSFWHGRVLDHVNNAPPFLNLTIRVQRMRFSLRVSRQYDGIDLLREPFSFRSVREALRFLNTTDWHGLIDRQEVYDYLEGNFSRDEGETMWIGYHNEDGFFSERLQYRVEEEEADGGGFILTSDLITTDPGSFRFTRIADMFQFLTSIGWDRLLRWEALDDLDEFEDAFNPPSPRASEFD